MVVLELKDQLSRHPSFGLPINSACKEILTQKTRTTRHAEAADRLRRAQHSSVDYQNDRLSPNKVCIAGQLPLGAPVRRRLASLLHERSRTAGPLSAPSCNVQEQRNSLGVRGECALRH